METERGAAPDADWLDCVNKSPSGQKSSTSPYANRERTSEWLLKQITGNISGAIENSDLKETEVLKIARRAVRKAENEADDYDC